MDSLTQIVLGAAVGEVVLGRKVGNKAMLWGAIAGTIPDLDVLSRSLFDDLRANEIHRGITHSILFSLVIAPLLGNWLKLHRRSLLAVFTLLIALVFVQGASSKNTMLMVMVIASLIIAMILWRGNRSDEVTAGDWTKLFWWCLVTHPLLDCHTTWGTQLFWPLPWKISYNNIFVVDPIYTVPFLVCVAVAMFYKRTDPRRKKWNRLGIVISTTYLVITIGLKLWAMERIKASMQRQEITWDDLSTRPTPFNSILWTVNASDGDQYHLAYHSLLDRKPEVDFVQIQKDHELLGPWRDHENVRRLIQLSCENYVITRLNDTLIFNDLRFGQIGEPSPDKPFVYSYKLIPDGNDLQVVLIPPGDVDGEQFNKLMGELWERVRGE